MAKRLAPPTRPRDKRKYRRDQEKFEFYRDKSGQWWGKSTAIAGAKRFKWKQPDFVGGQYKTPTGRWRKVDKKTGKNIATTPPRLAVKKPKQKRRRSTKNDGQALGLIRAILNNETSSLWHYQTLPPIVPRRGRVTRKNEQLKAVPGVTQGYRTVARYQSTKPYMTVFAELESVVREIGDNPVIQKAFDNRPTSFAIEFGMSSDDSGVWHWISPALSRTFNTTMSQAEPFIVEQSGKYQAMLDDKQPTFRIRQLQFAIE